MQSSKTRGDANLQVTGLKRDFSRNSKRAPRSHRRVPGDEMTNTQVIRLHKFARSQIEAIGDFATGLAHEINQPLTFINSVLGYLLDRLEKGGLDPVKAEELLRHAQREVRRISELLDNLYEFGEGNIGPTEELELRDLIEGLLQIMGRRLLSFSVDLTLTIPKGLPTVRGNKSQLQQCLLYLFDNAVEALERSDHKEKRINIEARVDEKKENILLYFSDNGVGVPSRYLDKVFEPFFTTKTEGNTPGLGLSILFSIIKNHEGRVRCLPSRRGALFELALPIYREKTAGYEE